MGELDNLPDSQPTEQTTQTPAMSLRVGVPLLLLCVLLIGAYFRFLNVDWDEGEHLHPDERYMTMVTDAIRSPGSADIGKNPPPGCEDWGGYFNSYCSPLNPYSHQGYGSYAYGTLPLFTARITGEWLSQACIDPADPDARPNTLARWVANLLFDDVEGCTGSRFTGYSHNQLLGRMLSALVDLGTVLLTFFIGRRLYNPWAGLLAAALYALAVLPIQQSHFYTVDAFAGFFITAAGFFAVRGAQGGRWLDFVLSGVAFGLALACKVSVWPFAAVIALAALLYYVYGEKPALASSSQAKGTDGGQRGRALDWLMVLLLVIFCFLVLSIAIFGIWSAVKITFFFAVALLAIGGVAFYILRPGGRGPGVSADGAMLRLMLAALCAFLAFRVTQPYAFVGSDFDVEQWQASEYDWLRDNVPKIWYTLNEKMPAPLRALILPDPRFIGTLGSVNKQLTGEADVPWGHQWTNRLPFVFPWVNMVFWGMGLPLGLLVWVGWGLVGWELWRDKRRAQHLIPWAWATILFFYQGTQWVKSIRYLLPTYPFFILLGAWLLARLWRRASAKWQGASAPRLPYTVYRLPLLIVLAGTSLWAWGFTRIYDGRAVTRNIASVWMVENIPTAATLHYEAAGEAKTHFLQTPPTYTYHEDAPPHAVGFVLPEDGIVTGVTFTHLSDPDQDAEPERFQVTLASDGTGENALAQAERGIQLEDARHKLGDAQHFELGPVPLSAGQEYFLISQVISGGPVGLSTTVIANEYPDDSLPNRVGGLNPFGGEYRGLQSSGDGKTHWDLNEDAGGHKLNEALEWLDEADVIALSSNRGYASIPRLPSRYPMAIAFYRALFAEELGFELIATFTSYPTIGPFRFPDQETPFSPGEPSMIRDELGSISIYLPPAEEAFSVYDHPQVFLFRKTPDFTRERAEGILGGVNTSQAVWQKPTEATLAPTAFQLNEQELDAQREGGTWTDIFDADGLLNRSPSLSVVVWWALMQILGWVAFPLLFIIAPGLRDRGWPLAKTLGLLLLATLVWLGANTRTFTYSRSVIFFTLLLMILVGGALAWWRRREIAAWAARERRTILVSELLFSGMFVAFLIIRYGNPDLWHPVMGGERPMDFAYLNAVIKSTHFPPYNPWFAGDYLNYYYYGFVIVGTPIKLLGILPETAINLFLPTFFALTGVGAYSVAFNLVGIRRSGDSGTRGFGDSESREPESRITRYAITAGLIAALFVAVLGNLSEVGVASKSLQELGSRDFEFESTIPGLEELVVSARGLFKNLVGGEPLPWRPEWPYWNASRAIPHPQGEEAPPITEFPFFSFLYSDPHAHLFALPLTLLALALALNWVLDRDFWWLHVRASALRWRRWFSAILGLVVGGVVIGALRPTNTWDYLTYLGLPLLTLTLGYALRQVGLQDLRFDLRTIRNGVVAVGGRFALLTALSYAFFLPYTTRFATAYNSVELWKGSKTVWWAYLVVHGLFLFAIVTWLLLKAWAWFRDPRSRGRLLLVLVLVFALLAARVAALINYQVALFVGALKDYQVVLFALPFGALALLVLVDRETSTAERLVALMGGVALALTLFPEVFVLKGDISRMNTVFRFYLQAWVLFGICAAVCIVWVFPRFKRSPGWRAWAGVLGLLVALAALYPILATRAKINDRWDRALGGGLDSMEWLERADGTRHGYAPFIYEYQALTWLRENVPGSPVVAEAAEGTPYRSLRARVATYTGLPTLIGYPWHQRQQHSFLNTDVVGQRERDANHLFNTHDLFSAKEILDRYDVAWIYIGDLERTSYDYTGIEKFEKMAQIGLLRGAYSNAGVTIYQVIQGDDAPVLEIQETVPKDPESEPPE